MFEKNIYIKQAEVKVTFEQLSTQMFKIKEITCNSTRAKIGELMKATSKEMLDITNELNNEILAEKTGSSEIKMKKKDKKKDKQPVGSGGARI